VFQNIALNSAKFVFSALSAKLNKCQALQIANQIMHANRAGGSLNVQRRLPRRTLFD
jgi:hypothetical protein